MDKDEDPIIKRGDLRNIIGGVSFSLLLYGLFDWNLKIFLIGLVGIIVFYQMMKDVMRG